MELEADHAGITSKLEKVISVQTNQNYDLFNEETFNNLVDDKTYTFSDINNQLADTYANLYSPSNSMEQSALQFNIPNNYYMNNNSTQLMNTTATPSTLANIFRMLKALLNNKVGPNLHWYREVVLVLDCVLFK